VMKSLIPLFDPHTSQYSRTSFLQGRRKFVNPFAGFVALSDALMMGGMGGMLVVCLVTILWMLLC
jgi:hypothetical protein